jgi:hypothetical protein
MLLPRQIFAGGNATPVTLGIQLYSVREDMKTDPAGTLKQLAAMG